jgi:L-alanine-DL-glutamate epimerase-like enolase superfamily enzyme
MTIAFDTRAVTLTPTHPFRIARSEHAAYHHWLVRLADAGDEGWGEAAPSRRYGETAETVASALAELLPLVGDDPYAMAAIERRLDGHLWENASAKTAISAALHDLVGKRHGLPLYRWLGLDLERVPPTSFTIGIAEPEEMRRKVEEAGPYPILKIKLGFAGDVEALERIRAMTDKPIRVDANEGWTRAEALARLPALEDLGVELLEQPVPAADREGLALVSGATSIPVVADEACRTTADLPGLLGVVDVVNVKLAKTGSIGEAVRLMTAARALHFGVFLGCMVESSLGIAAAAHLAPLADWVDLDGHLLLADDPFEGLRLEAGRVLPDPDAPGLGVRPKAAGAERPAGP